MGTFTFKKRRNHLDIWYTLAPFEAIVDTKRVDTLCLEPISPTRLHGYFENHLTMSDYFKQGITLLEFLFCLLDIVKLLKNLEADYLNTNEMIYHINQFIISEHTKKVKFIYLKTIGVTEHLTLDAFKQNCIACAVFPSDERIDDVLSQLLNAPLTVEAIEKMIITYKT